MRTYYLFVEESNINDIFKNLLISTRELGIRYLTIKENLLLPSYIVIESIYKDEYFKNKISEELINIGYDKLFKILKPLSKEIIL